jgi:hypothetical protein
MLLGLAALVCGALYTLAAGGTAEGAASSLHITLLVATACCAVIPPHVLFPEPDAAWLRVSNPSAPQLLARAARRWGGALFVMLAALASVAFAPGAAGEPYGAGARGMHLLAHALAAFAVWSYALLAYARLGTVSQEYQEGSKGDWLRGAMEHTSAGRLEIPYGLAPSLMATVRVFLAGMLAVLAVAQAENVAGGWASVAVGLAVALASAYGLRRAAATFDRAYYHTDALYREVLHVTPLDADAREPVAYDAVYWVPHRWRPLAWASLRQMDRRLPLGRIVALLHAALWLVVWRGGADAALAVSLLAVTLAPILAGTRGQGANAWPGDWSAWLASPKDWAMARGFVALRWLAPLVATLLGLVYLAGTLALEDAAAWALLYAALAFGTGFVQSVRHARAARYP